MKKLSIILSFLLIVFSCSDDAPITETSDIGSVGHAQKWFEQNVNTLPGEHSNSRNHAQLKSLSWEEGISYVMDKTPTVEVPIQFETELIAHPETAKENSLNKNVTKLLLFDDGEGGYNVFIMRIMPNKSSVAELDQNFYNKKTNSFTGDILYYSWEGIPLVYARYENGKREELGRLEHASKKKEARTNECYLTEVRGYSVACSSGGCGDPIYLYSDYYYYCSYSGPGSNPNDSEDPGDLYGGGGSGNGNAEIPISPEYIGNKPLYEYANKCQGLQDIWNNFPNNEMYGYITADGKLIVTNQLPFTGGAAFGAFLHANGTTYYPYPMNQFAPNLNYAGMIQYPTNNPTHYLIPVVASVHTHSPCRTDGTNGVSHPVGTDDKIFAATHAQISHWVIGCNSIAKYTGTTNNFINVLSGNISTTCNSIQ